MSDASVAQPCPEPEFDAVSSVAPATEPPVVPSLSIVRKKTGRRTNLSKTGVAATYLTKPVPRPLCDICHFAPQNHPRKQDPYCTPCRQQMRSADHSRRVGKNAKRIGHELIVMLFDQYLGDRSLDCMSEIGAHLAEKLIVAWNLAYIASTSMTPTATQLFCRIVAKYDPEKRLLPAIKEALGHRRFYVPRYLGRSRTLWMTPKDLTFSLIDYLKPSDDSSFKRLADLQDQMNLMAKKILFADELPLAISAFNNIAAALHKATASNLWECFEATLIKTMRLRILQHSSERGKTSAGGVLTRTEVEQLSGLAKMERDLRGEVGASPKAARRLGLGTGDSISELIDRAGRLSGGRGPTFAVDDEQEAGRELLGRESSLGTDLAQPDDEAGRLPDADVALALRETVDSLLKEA